MVKGGEIKVTFGGWYQRTTLHLTEVYEFLKKGDSRLELSKKKLKKYRENLNLKLISRESGKLEYVKAITHSGIEIRYYEDGLYVLEVSSSKISDSSDLLKNYFTKFFKPAIEYLFSLGSPTPKILSNIKEEHPIIVSKIDREHAKYSISGKYGGVYSETHSRDMSVYKTEDYIFIVASPAQEKSLDSLVEMHIFFREFKDQLHKYLNIHRNLWEEVEEIKEKKQIRGRDISNLKSRLEGDKKTIDLIGNRINQMSTYAHTRASLSKFLKVDQNLLVLFQYKFEDLFNSLNYIKEIWGMTVDYVNSAIRVLTEIDNKASLGGIHSIQILASIGVVTGVLGYLTNDTLPTISAMGAGYLVGLGVIAFIVDQILRNRAKNKEYSLNFIEREKKI